MKKVELCTYRNVLNYNREQPKQTPNQIYKNIQLNQKEIAKEKRRKEQESNKYINENYNDLFEKMEVFLFIVSVYQTSIIEFFNNLPANLKEENGEKIKALNLVLITLLEKYNEIIYLLKGGFLYGALSGLRSILELTVITYIISSSNNETAHEYFLFANKEDDYYNWSKKSKLVKEKIEKSNHFKERNIRFNFLKKIFEENVSKTFSKWYEECSKYIHKSPKKVIERYENDDDLINTSFGVVKDQLELPAKIATLLMMICCSFLDFREDDRKSKEILYILDKECADIVEKCDVLNSIHMDKN
ncbi:DUF5677 domain-containing protein [Anaerorhabdus sp.]|uniref:DUF5677 domain-containing protein n=1 Tax=Anaerorhabdus sp. TaxID=1872524 RepID=UPI002FCC9264